MTYKTRMRSTFFKQWVVYSAPLLFILVYLWWGFDSEDAVANFFAAHATAHPDLRAILTFITDWSNPLFYGIYSAMLIGTYRNKDTEKRRFIFFVIALQLIISLLTVHFIKYTIGRPRPGQGWYFDPLTSRGNYHSLPSGHTCEIVGWSLPLTLRIRDWVLTSAFSLCIGMVGFSRIYLGWHHPSDVFFGWLLGSFVGLSVQTLVQTSLFRTQAQS
jgi:undecaprenyl-diphosphatase